MPNLRYDPSSVVLHIPHSSKHIPINERRRLLLSDPDLQHELLRITDAFTDELFDLGGRVPKVVHPVSRLVVDPERFEDDGEERMAVLGMGVIYTRTVEGRDLRNLPTATERQELLTTYYRPHHASFATAVNEALAQHDRCLIIDCHSFPGAPLPYELDQRPRRPDVCLGTDPFHTPEELWNKLVSSFAARGYLVAANRPFSGSIVPACFYRRNPKVSSVMVEINRSLYMDEATGAKSADFEHTRNMLSEVLQTCVDGRID